VALAKHWGCSPTHLRDLTLDEITAMVDLITATHP
jgi:hypothetical protein